MRRMRRDATMRREAAPPALTGARRPHAANLTGINIIEGVIVDTALESLRGGAAPCAVPSVPSKMVSVRSKSSSAQASQPTTR